MNAPLRSPVRGLGRAGGLNDARTGLVPQRTILGDGRGGARGKVRCIQIILAGDANQREQGIDRGNGSDDPDGKRSVRFHLVGALVLRR